MKTATLLPEILKCQDEEERTAMINLQRLVSTIAMKLSYEVLLEQNN